MTLALYKESEDNPIKKANLAANPGNLNAQVLWEAVAGFAICDNKRRSFEALKNSGR